MSSPETRAATCPLPSRPAFHPPETVKTSLFTPHRASTLLLALCLSIGSLRGAEQTPTEETLPLRFRSPGKTIWLEPKPGTFIPVSFARESEQKIQFSLGSRKQSNGLLAIYNTDGNTSRFTLPVARFKIFSLREGSASERVEVTLAWRDGKLHLAARDLQHKTNPLRIAQISKDEMLAANVVPPKAANKLPAIAAAEGLQLKQAVGMRGSNGLFQPILPAESLPGESATVYFHPKHVGKQTTGDVVIYSGDNYFIENDKVAGRYLIGGLSTSDKAQFALTFTVNKAGKVELTAARDTATKKLLQIYPYSPEAARRLQENFRDTQPAPKALLPKSPVGAS